MAREPCQESGFMVFAFEENVGFRKVSTLAVFKSFLGGRSGSMSKALTAVATKLLALGFSRGTGEVGKEHSLLGPPAMRSVSIKELQREKEKKVRARPHFVADERLLKKKRNSLSPPLSTMSSATRQAQLSAQDEDALLSLQVRLFDAKKESGGTTREFTSDHLICFHIDLISSPQCLTYKTNSYQTKADFEARKFSPSAALAKKKEDGENGERKGGKEEDERKAPSMSAASQAAAPEKPGPQQQQQQQEQEPPAPRQQHQGQQQHPFELVGEVVERRRAGKLPEGGSSASTSTSTSTPTTAGGFPAATHRRQSKVRILLFLRLFLPER